MKYLLILSCFFSKPNIWDLFSVITGVIALVISFGFLFRPRIRCSIFIKNDLIHVKLFNCNKYRKLLTDIQCEIIVSDDFAGTVDTLKLRKSWIISLLNAKETEEHPNYTFITKESYANKKYVKVKFLIPNFLGIKKAYEFAMPISKLNDNKCMSITPKNPSRKSINPTGLE